MVCYNIKTLKLSHRVIFAKVIFAFRVKFMITIVIYLLSVCSINSYRENIYFVYMMTYTCFDYVTDYCSIVLL